MTTQSGKQMGCSRQAMMKLPSLNGINVCELVFVPKIDIISTCFDFQTIYLLGGLK